MRTALRCFDQRPASFFPRRKFPAVGFVTHSLASGGCYLIIASVLALWIALFASPLPACLAPGVEQRQEKLARLSRLSAAAGFAAMKKRAIASWR